MITKISNNEVLTSLEARRKYEKNYIGFITVEQKIMDFDNEKVKVLYTADSNKESYNIPSMNESGELISLMAGMGAGETVIGNLIYE
jgi:hypothetical protein